MTEKMTYEKAKELESKCVSGTWECGCIGGEPDQDCLIAEGFLEGWEARMEFEAKLNGKPNET